MMMRRDAIEGDESTYEAEKDTEGADEVDEEEETLGSDFDELEFEEESSSEEEEEVEEGDEEEDEQEDFAELTNLCTRRSSRIAQACQ